MSTASAGVANVQGRRISFLTMVIAGGAIATFAGLATAGSLFFGMINAEAKAPSSQIVVVAPAGPASANGSATLEIVPSPVIDPNPVFFFGTGDGSSGYYAERPLDERQTIRSAGSYESAL
jgi:hypothetical protein